uniref:Uncharacterized protein n=1 Tax=Meloidogyne enterolobii TaxID=390850 RepID=A0A6V7UV35_MELEN|nr:unnamed protein product [Meloidogyne enterolobii]
MMKNKKKFDNVDFLIKLDFYAQRLSEEIAEEAVKDIKEIELIRRNPRAVYFDDQFKEYLLQECEEEQEEEEEEEEEGIEKNKENKN